MAAGLDYITQCVSVAWWPGASPMIQNYRLKFPEDMEYDRVIFFQGFLFKLILFKIRLL